MVVLVAYATDHGSTRGIAVRIASTLVSRLAGVERRPAAAGPRPAGRGRVGVEHRGAKGLVGE